LFVPLVVLVARWSARSLAGTGARRLDRVRLAPLVRAPPRGGVRLEGKGRLAPEDEDQRRLARRRLGRRQRVADGGE
jgi:hypothetical protein